MTDAIGWISSAILFATVAKQVHKQWVTEDAEGVSIWLFIGQIAASVGFLVYSAMVGNAVFVATNALMVLNALTGLYIVRRNRRRAARDGEGGGPPVDTDVSPVT